MERNASRPKDIERRYPKPLVVEVKVNGQQVRALLDSGSLGDFISTTVTDQLKLQRETLAKPIGLQMAVAGSRSSINHSVLVQFGYQNIDCMRRFDVINIDKYDMILGTPFLFQHRVILSMNPPSVAVGSTTALPISGDQLLEISSLATDLYEIEIEKCREQLRVGAADLCKSMDQTELPPFRAINHTIPLIDEGKQYRTRTVRCPKPLQEVYERKVKAYI
ncbi:hypothetical protein BDV93DRAFT_430586, partial [Ceratobasidium sp. AG-I]